MSNVSYTIFSKPKHLTTFASGNNWLIGLTALKKEVLLARIKPLLETDNFDPDKVQTIIYNFIDWFIDDYEQREKKECTLDDKDIVESVGIIQFDESGKLIPYKYGRFEFYKAVNGSVKPLSGPDEKLLANEILIADPKNADISESISDIETSYDSEPDVVKYEDFLYPFALIKSVANHTGITDKPKKNYTRVWLSILVLLVIVFFGWQYKDQLQSLVVSFNKPAKTTIATPDSLLTRNEVVPDSLEQTSSPIKKNPETESSEIEEYYQKAEDMLSFARAFMEDGKNIKALNKLDSAEYFYNKYVQLKPEKRKIIQPKLNELQSRKSLINEAGL
jgi:hypothetical protein